MFKIVAALGLATALLASPALAETGSMPMGMHGPMMGKGGGCAGRDMTRHLDGHVAFLKAELKITPAQEAEWTVFADALRSSAATMGPMMGLLGQTESVTQTFEQKERLLTTRLENTRRMHAAWSKLEPVLSADQRKAAAELIGTRMMRM
jgi:hypothetical protein